MSRIVAGAARGRRLVVPADGTRPTSARAREALFSTLIGLIDIDNARVLDLFAGSGAVGLEALSRGAATAVFVESAPVAVRTLRRNIEVVGLAGAVVRSVSAQTYLSPGASTEVFDLAFADPPYAFADDALAQLLASLAGPAGWLAPDAVVVVERSARSDPPHWPSVIEAIKSRRYGEGVLWYGRRK